MLDYRINRPMRSIALTSAWERFSDGEYLLIQASAAIRISYGDDTTKYFTYQTMTSPLMIIGGCQIRAETTATLLLAGIEA